MDARGGHEALEQEGENNKRPGTRQRWEDAHADGGNGARGRRCKSGRFQRSANEDGPRTRLDREDARFSKNFDRRTRLCRRHRLVVLGLVGCEVARLRGSPPIARYIYLPITRLIVLFVSRLGAPGFPLVLLRLFVLSYNVYFPFAFLSLGAAPSRNN